jgi:hypothetical protein
VRHAEHEEPVKELAGRSLGPVHNQRGHEEAPDGVMAFANAQSYG